jgi:leucyl aminopeptidase
MFFKLQKSAKGNLVYLFDNTSQLAVLNLEKNELNYVKEQLKEQNTLIRLNKFSHQIFLVKIESESTWKNDESIRKQGAKLCAEVNGLKLDNIAIDNLSTQKKAAYFLAEGAALANYQFLKYKATAKKLSNSFKDIFFLPQALTLKEVKALEVIIDAVYRSRDLINEPLHYVFQRKNFNKYLNIQFFSHTL